MESLNYEPCSVHMMGRYVGVLDEHCYLLKSWKITPKFNHEDVLDWMMQWKRVPDENSVISFPWLKVLVADLMD